MTPGRLPATGLTLFMVLIFQIVKRENFSRQVDHAQELRILLARFRGIIHEALGQKPKWTFKNLLTQ